MEKLDFKKSLKSLYTAKQQVEEVDVPQGTFLAIDGRGMGPGNSAFEQSVGKLYGLAYTLKFSRKAAAGQDFTVSPMEALWFDDPLSVPDMSQWRWRMLMRVPDEITEGTLAPVREAVAKKGGADASDVHILTMAEGRCVQVMHVGPYDQVSEAYARLGAYAQAHGLRVSGPGHEVYLSDPRRTAPERLKTVVRIPVHPA